MNDSTRALSFWTFSEESKFNVALPAKSPASPSPEPNSGTPLRWPQAASISLSVREAEHLDQVFELPQRLLVEGGGGETDVGGGDDAAELEDLLADAHASDAELCLETDQGQIAEVIGLSLSSLVFHEEPVGLDEDVRVGEAGHDAARAAAELLVEVHPA